MEKKNVTMPLSENYHLERITNSKNERINVLRLITPQGPALVFIGSDKEFVDYLSTMQR